MENFINKLSVFIVFIFLSGNLYSQSLSLQNYTADDGLPQNTVFSIVQDSVGFIWVGTEAGVARFDGNNFKIFGLEDGLVGTGVRTLFLDKEKNIWMGTTSGVSKYANDKFVNYTKNDGLADNYIYSITQDTSGAIWFATRAKGITKLQDSVFTNYNIRNGLPSNKTRSILTDTEGNLWIATWGRGIVKYNGHKFKSFTTNSGLVNNYAISLYQDSKQNIWIGTKRGISKFKDGKFTNFTSINGLPRAEVRTIVEDIYGNIWFGLYGAGIAKFDGQKFKMYGKHGSKRWFVQSSFLDKRGDIWFGTFLDGLSRLPADWFEIYDKSNGLADDAVFAISEGADYSIYFGHYGAGITELSKKSIKYITTKNGLISNNTSSMLFDNYKNLWVGTFSGLTRFHDSQATNLTINEGLYNNRIISIEEDRNNNIWFGCEGGISKFDRLENKISNSFDSTVSFGDGWVNDIYESRNGDLWFATETKGVVKYDGRKFTFLNTKNGMSTNEVFTITQDQIGNFWFATNGMGLIKYDGKKFTNFTKKSGLSSNVCYFAVEDRGILYIGTTNGLTMFDYLNYDKKGAAAFRYYTKSDGLPFKEFNQGSYLKDSRGYLWFGTQKGVIKIDPNKKARITTQRILMRSVKISDGNREDVFGNIFNKELKYNQNNITFDFFTIAFNQPNKIIYEIKLDGIEDKWSKTHEHKVSYRALPPGHYSFEVKVRNSDGMESKDYILSTFTIKPPYYLTWWFITLAVLFVLLLIYNIYYYKTQQVRKRNIELGEMVKERTKELEVEKNKSDELLLNILPATLVEELKKDGKVRPREFKHVSIIFTDFKDFTYTASVLPAESLVDELNDIFREFDEIVENYGLEKLKTVGDSYMAASGLPEENENHAIRVVSAAIEMKNLIAKRNETSAIKWEMRLGIHTGSVIAGVVGTKKFTYDIWGDTVNIASRMESSGEPGEVNISGYTYMLVRDYFECQYRGKIDAKGKGFVDMYFVRGIKKERETELKSLYTA